MTLVIMAAGMGSRFGGLKQLEPLDSSGHILIDYSVNDAIKAGFDRVVFIIRRDIEADFKKIIFPRLSKWKIKVDYAYQELYDMPVGFYCPTERKKPWGTAQAVASLGDLVDSPFALINADDYYGPSAFSLMAEFLSRPAERWVMIAYRLKNTLSRTGSVSRGLCRVENDRLVEICETTGIHLDGGRIISDENRRLDPDSRVSMNFWGFTPRIIEECRDGFSSFIEKAEKGELLKREYYLTDVISMLINRGLAEIEVMESQDRWYGVTNRADTSEIKIAFDTLISEGKYPKEF